MGVAVLRFDAHNPSVKQKTAGIHTYVKETAAKASLWFSSSLHLQRPVNNNHSSRATITSGWLGRILLGASAELANFGSTS